MFFASPIWLALLPPWAAVAVWLMWSRRGQRTDVPFLALWRDGAENSPREKREFRPPPLALVAALMAALLAIVAAARPGFLVASADQGPLVTVIVDRGITMSVRDRLADVIEAARPAVGERFGNGPTDLLLVPDGTAQRVSRLAWANLAASATPAQEQTNHAVRLAVQRVLARTDGPVIVLSDHAIPDHSRVVQVAPAKAPQNVAIANFVVREFPQPQAMVTVTNWSHHERAILRVRSGERVVVERPIDLPRAAGGEASFFINLPSLEPAAAAEIEVPDDITIDNMAHAKRQRTFPEIEVRAAVPAEVRRVVDAYSKARPAQAMSGRIAVAGDDAVPSDVPVAIVSTSAPDDGAGAVTVAAHPVAAGVDWADAKAQAAGVPPGQGWRTIVSVGDRAAIAIRETPHRQVWVGFYAPEFARTPEFVIFWTNVFDWLAGGETDAAQHWGSTVVPPVQITPPPAADWRARLAALQPPHRRRSDVSSAVVLASVTCLILAALAWPRRRLTAISVPRTV